MLTKHQYERYNRQLLLPQLGVAGQQKLLAAKVLVIGAGGLGCAMLPYLAAAGVGTIGICDDDTVQLHNLHRQVMYNSTQLGLQKAICAASFLQAQNPEIKIVAYTERLTNKNALSLFTQYDIIADGTDNFATRYLINDACVLLKKPLVYGAIAMFEGQVAVFNAPSLPGQPTCNYRDIFPEPPAENEIPNCAEAGVIGVLPAIIGSMQANEIIKLVTGIGQPLTNQLFVYNALDCNSYKFIINKDPATIAGIPQDETAFTNFDYESACSVAKNTAEITPAGLSLLAAGTYQLVDVRNADELPVMEVEGIVQIQLIDLEANTSELTAPVIITVCQTGVRSKRAVEILKSKLPKSSSIMSLKGGILEWLKLAEHDGQKA